MDGLAPAYVAFKAACALCRPIDRLEVLHIYSDSSSSWRRSSALSLSTAASGGGLWSEDGSVPPNPASAPSSSAGLVFGADLSPTAIKAMYEAELAKDAALSPLRRVLCLSRPSGSTVAEEIVSHVNSSGCDMLVVGFENVGGMSSAGGHGPGGARGAAAGSDANMSKSLPSGSLAKLSSGASVESGAGQGQGSLGVVARPMSVSGSRGDRCRVFASDLR